MIRTPGLGVRNWKVKSPKKWLDALARTANSKDYEARMELISKEANVHGVPGFEDIDYIDWAKQCKHEFEQGLLQRVSYEGLEARTLTLMSLG